MPSLDPTVTGPSAHVVLFDLDGTLANTIPLIVASYQHALLTVLGETVDEVQVRGWIGRSLLDVMLARSPEHGHELDRVYREWNSAHTSALIRRYPGISELLDTLAGAGTPMAVATSKRRDTARAALDAVGLAGRLEVVAALEDTDRHKPAPDPLLHAAAALRVDPAWCVYVGDAVVDVQAAQAAGMTAVAVTWGAGERDALHAAQPAAVVETVAELTGYLLDATG